MVTRSLSSAEWLIIEILAVNAHLVRGQYEWHDTLAPIDIRIGNYSHSIVAGGLPLMS